MYGTGLWSRVCACLIVCRVEETPLRLAWYSRGTAETGGAAPNRPHAALRIRLLSLVNGGFPFLLFFLSLLSGRVLNDPVLCGVPAFGFRLPSRIADPPNADLLAKMRNLASLGGYE